MEKNVLELLEKSANSFKEKAAVIEIDDKCSFENLCMDSKRIGSALIKRNIFGKTIPVFSEKSILTLKTFFGITYAGGCYSLINTSQPKDRIEKILSVINPPVVITDSTHFAGFNEVDYSGEVILVEDIIEEEIDEEGLQEIRHKTLDTDPLYVNFTSGSTGIPKGVVVGHQSVIEFIHYFTELFNFSSDDIIGNQAPFDFDVSVKDIYSMLMTGATMFIIPKDYFAFPKIVLEALSEYKVTTLTWAVSALCMITSLNGFSYKIPEAVNKVIFSGEVMPMSHLKAWKKALPDARFVNVYGPTEITCNCTYFEVTEECLRENKLPIGKPFPNERIMLLGNDNKEITEFGEEGEICVVGPCLALGYYSDEERTAKAFVQNPLNTSYRQLMYRTGDVGYYREDGNLMYVGRKDFQIKHLGHRIELNEIELYINQIEGVKRVCCLYDEQKQQIVAFIQGNVEKSNIRKELRSKLIKYMIPERYVFVEKMPATPNGKIDRKKLRKEYFEEA